MAAGPFDKMAGKVQIEPCLVLPVPYPQMVHLTLVSLFHGGSARGRMALARAQSLTHDRHVLSVTRLSADDRLILWPDEVWPQDIGALGVLDGSSLLDSDGRFRIEDAKRAVDGRLHLLPRFRQVLYVPTRGLGGPLWVDAPSVDVSDHVGVIAITPPGGEAEVLRAVAPLRRRRLDTSRPLWEMWFLTGLPDAALVSSCSCTTSSRTASPVWLNLVCCWMQHRVSQRHQP